MASTPPPLPSSSEDSDFDDDDFGCFSSAPVKAASKSISDVKENQGGLTKTEDNSLKAEKEIPAELDNIISVKDHSEDKSAKGEEMSTDLFALDQFDETVPPEPSQVPSDSNEELSDVISNSSQISQGDYDLKAADTIDQVTNNENCTQDKIESVEHSIVEGKDGGVEFSEKENVVHVGDERIIAGDDGTNCNQAEEEVNDSKESATDLPCGSKDENDEFGDWSDMQTFKSNDVGDMASEAQNESLKTNDIDTSEISQIQDGTAATVDLETDHIPFDSSALSYLPRNDCSNIPLESNDALAETGNNQYSNLPDNDHDLDIMNEEDDDGFGDFADFSSNEVNDTNERAVPPLSLKTNATDDREEGVFEDYKDGSDVRTEGVNNETDKSDVEKAGNFDDGGGSDVENAGNFEDKGNNDFDDDDWGFQSALTKDNDNGSDDFGNFGSVDDGNGGSDWASFNDAPTTPAVAANDDDDDDFNDFSDGDFQASITPSVNQSESISSKIQDSTSKVEKVVFMCFPEDISQVNQTYASQNKENNCDKSETDIGGGEIDNLCSVIEIGLNVTPKAKEETWTIVKELRNKDPVVGTWGRLKDVNSSHALNYGWSSSHCCQEIFSTLHIDTKNVLFSQKKQAVPFYASGLGILEPIRGGPNPAEKNQPNVAPTPALLDTTTKPEDVKKSLDIPPVDFDWGSSGLTNPLKVFKNDSFNNGLSSLEPFSDVLHKNIEPTKELSSEAKSILSKIPNLNFMRSNVLMFPIKD